MWMMAQYTTITFIRPSNTHPKESFLLKIVQRYIAHAMLVGKCKKDEKINTNQKNVLIHHMRIFKQSCVREIEVMDLIT